MEQHFPVILRGSIAANIKKAAQFGYDAVEIHVGDPGSLDLPEIIKASEENKIQVATIGTGLAYVKDKLSFTHPRQETRARAVERIRSHINAAKSLNAKVIIGSVRGPIPDKSEYEKYEGYAIDCLQRCLEKAEKEKVELVIEAINRYETNFINNVDEGIAFIKKIGSEHLKLHIDTFHMNLEEANFIDSIHKAGAFLGHIHLADSNRRYPGSGHINFKEIIAALKNIGYKDTLALECLPLPAEEEAATRGISYLKPLI